MAARSVQSEVNNKKSEDETSFENDILSKIKEFKEVAKKEMEEENALKPKDEKPRKARKYDGSLATGEESSSLESSLEEKPKERKRKKSAPAKRGKAR